MKDKWSIYNKANLFLIHSREYHVLNLLKYFNLYDLKEKKILEIGCGSSFELRNFLRYGARARNLYGIDIDFSPIKRAKSINDNIIYKVSDAKFLPFKDKVFDIIIAFVFFSSLLKIEDRAKAAKEMLRVLKDDGLIIFYDFFVKKPKNKNVEAIKKKEIKKLFNNCNFYFKKITFMPIILRRLPSFFLFFYYFLELLKIFNTHYLIGIKKIKVVDK